MSEAYESIINTFVSTTKAVCTVALHVSYFVSLVSWNNIKDWRFKYISIFKLIKIVCLKDKMNNVCLLLNIDIDNKPRVKIITQLVNEKKIIIRSK